MAGATGPRLIFRVPVAFSGLLAFVTAGVQAWILQEPAQDTTTYLNGIKVDNQADLVKSIKERLEEMADTAKVVYLKGDENLPYSEIMKVMDFCREAGVEEIALIAEAKVQG